MKAKEKKIANVYSKSGVKFASIYQNNENKWFYFVWAGCTPNFCCKHIDTMEQHIRERENYLSDGYIKYLKSFKR